MSLRRVALIPLAVVLSVHCVGLRYSAQIEVVSCILGLLILNYLLFGTLSDIAELGRRGLAVVIVLCVLVITLRCRTQLEPIACIVGIALLWRLLRIEKFCRFALAAVVTVTGLLAVELGTSFFDAFMANNHALPSWVERAMLYLVDLVVPRTGIGESHLSIVHSRGTEIVRLRPEFFGDSTMAVVLTCSFLVYFTAAVAYPMRVLSFLVVACATMLLRGILKILWSIESGTQKLVDMGYYGELFVSYGMALLALLAAERVSRESQAMLERNQRDKPLILLTVAAVCVFLSSATFERQADTAGSVIFDEFHSEWERTDVPFNATEYGPHTTYNYRSFYDDLSSHGYQVERNYGPISRNTLRECQVLVLKTPTRPYLDAEISTILDFVWNGGSLLMIGDHTNVFGMSSYLNDIARNFGIEFVSDAIETYSGDPQVIDEREGLGDILMPDVARVSLATSCSLKLRGDASALMVGDKVFADGMSTGTFNFFGDHRWTYDEPFGSFVQAAGSEFGTGRVYAWTDSTVFSNFSYFMPGNSESAHSALSWLSRRALQSSWLRRILGVFGGVLLLCAFLSSGSSVAGKILCLFTFVLVSCAGQAVGQLMLPRETTTQAGHQVIFFGDGCDYSINRRISSESQPGQDYATMFVWCQRLGLRPKLAAKGEGLSCFDGQSVVLIRPSAEYWGGRIEEVTSFVKGGGALIVFDDRDETEDSAAPSMARSFELSIGSYFPVIDIKVLGDRVDDKTLVRLEGGREVKGIGRRVVTTDDDLAIGIAKNVGAGQIAFVGLSSPFTSSRLGSFFGTPDSNQEQLSTLLIAILRAILGH